MKCILLCLRDRSCVCYASGSRHESAGAGDYPESTALAGPVNGGFTRKESEPWNKGKIIGQKPPLLPKHVWAIRTKLRMEKRVRDLALFNLAMDSKLRGCDVARLRLEDVAPNGYVIERAVIRQQKTGHPVKFELTEQTRCSVDEYLKSGGRDSQRCLFPGRGVPATHLTTRQYARLLGQ